jgi:hypothetical protein
VDSSEAVITLVCEGTAASPVWKRADNDVPANELVAELNQVLDEGKRIRGMQAPRIRVTILNEPEDATRSK